MFKSIRTRLTLWYAFVLSVILVCFCVVLYFSIAFTLNKQVDHVLRKQAHNISDSYLPETDGFRNVPEQDYISSPLIWFRLVKLGGRLFRPSPTFHIFQQPFPLQNAQSIRSETPIFKTFTLGNQTFRSIIYPVEATTKRVGWVQLIMPISDVAGTLKTIRTYIFILVPLATLLLSIGGNFLARTTLRPIDSIRRQVDEIYGKNLSRRIDVVKPDDELGLLALTFNQMLERLQEAFESQRRFLADASHEIKTPLAILKSQWEKLADAKTMPIQYKKEIHSNLEELARLAQLVDNLLLLSEIDDNRIKIEQKPVNLQKVLEEIFEDGKILAEQKDQSITLESLESVVISGDHNRLLQLFLNLVDNAVKYTPEKGEISFYLSKKNKTTFVEIRDTGIGISEKDLQCIFDRFYRVDKSRSRQQGGSGLGLSICEWIVNAHHGSINIQSEIGRGTKVTVEFMCN